MLLDEAKKVLAAAGYKVVSEKTELQESFRDFKRKLVVESEDDDDYVLPDHQKDKPDPSTYRDDLDDVEDWEHCPAYYGKADTLDDEDYIDPSETVEGGLSDDDYIDPETNLDDEPIEDYNGEEDEEWECDGCGTMCNGEGYYDEDTGRSYCSYECYEESAADTAAFAADQYRDMMRDRMYGESCECGKKGCCCGGKKSKKKGKKGKSNKGWVPFWQYKKGKKDED